LLARHLLAILGSADLIGEAITGGDMDNQPSGWAVGWTMFASIMMIVMGFWWIITGIVAIAKDEFFVITQEWVFEFDVTAWGWIHLILGIVILAAGFGLYTAQVWARTVGVIIAAIAALVAFAWMPYYPIWGIIFVAVSVAVIWALTAHGRDIEYA
jgi:hypothetical protein